MKTIQRRTSLDKIQQEDATDVAGKEHRDHLARKE